MEKTKITDALASLRKESKRNFAQSVDLIINLKDLNLKKPDEQVDQFISLPHGGGKVKKICGLVGPELVEESKKNLDHTLTLSDFETLTKKDIKKLTEEYDFFIAQANIMPKVAATFGRIFGPRNKMPNPKAGCVVPPKANLKVLKERLNNTIRVKAKAAPIAHCAVGVESQSDEDILSNVTHVYNIIVHSLPKEANNVKNVYLKLTMGKSVKVM